MAAQTMTVVVYPNGLHDHLADSPEIVISRLSALGITCNRVGNMLYASRYSTTPPIANRPKRRAPNLRAHA